MENAEIERAGLNKDAMVFIVGSTLVIGPPTLGIASVLDNYAGPLLIFGGTKCNNQMGIYACYGYAPPGLVLIGLAVGMAGAFVAGAIQHWRGE